MNYLENAITESKFINPSTIHGDKTTKQQISTRPQRTETTQPTGVSPFKRPESGETRPRGPNKETAPERPSGHPVAGPLPLDQVLHLAGGPHPFRLHDEPLAGGDAVRRPEVDVDGALQFVHADVGLLLDGTGLGRGRVGLFLLGGSAVGTLPEPPPVQGVVHAVTFKSDRPLIIFSGFTVQ